MRIWMDVRWDVQFTDSPDSLLIWLPMIGEEGRLKVVSNKQDCACRPNLSSDYSFRLGIFPKGTIHIIQSSHQDIAWMDTPDFCRK